MNTCTNGPRARIPTIRFGDFARLCSIAGMRDSSINEFVRWLHSGIQHELFTGLYHSDLKTGDCFDSMLFGLLQ